MAIKMNTILPNGDGKDQGKERGGSGGARRPGINMHAILPEQGGGGNGDGQSRPTGERSGRINLRAILPDRFNPAAQRAKAAAEQARVEALRQQEEARKAQGVADARQQIAEAGKGEERLAQYPLYSAGWRKALQRLAQRDPEQALKVAQKHIELIRAHNDRILAAPDPEEVALQAQEVARLRTEELNAHPIVNAQFRWGSGIVIGPQESSIRRTVKSTAKGILGFGAGVTTLVTRAALATLSGHPENAFDEVRADGSGVHVIAPLKPVTRRDITGENAGDHDITVDPPDYLDRPIAVLSALPFLSRDRVEGWLPFGRIEIRDRRSNAEIGAGAAWFPARTARRVKGILKEMAPPKTTPGFIGPPPTIIAEPVLRDLLGDAATDILGVEGGADGLDFNRPYSAPGYTPMPGE